MPEMGRVAAARSSLPIRGVWGLGLVSVWLIRWKPTTVIRAAYGLMYDSASTPAILNQQGFFAQTALQSTNGGVTPAFNWNSRLS